MKKATYLKRMDMARKGMKNVTTPQILGKVAKMATVKKFNLPESLSFKKKPKRTYRKPSNGIGVGY